MPLSIEFRTGREFAQSPEVLLDGSPIRPAEVVSDGSSLIWRWPFCAEHWCGRTNLEVISDGATKTLTLHSVPSGTKYSADEYDRMLERLRTYGASLDIGLAPVAAAAALIRATPIRATHLAVSSTTLGICCGNWIAYCRNRYGGCACATMYLRSS
jgi:hypothetical protein